jgi:uncharacterized protein YktB (UPF0637 family)
MSKHAATDTGPGRPIFEVFTIDDFAGRMTAIRQTVSPWLENLGEEIAPALSELVGEPIFIHVARHARRTVNPPEDTWVAFGPGKRGYKKERHFKVAVSLGAVRFLFEIGPEFTAKAAWAEAWSRRARSMSARFSGTDLAWFRNEHDEEPAASLAALSPAELASLADHLVRGRDGQLVAGRRLTSREAIRLEGNAFLDAAITTFQELVPLYLLDRDGR